MATKKEPYKVGKPTKPVLDPVAKAQARVLLLASRWARDAETRSVLQSSSHHLMRAVQKLETLQARERAPTKSPASTASPKRSTT